MKSLSIKAKITAVSAIAVCVIGFVAIDNYFTVKKLTALATETQTASLLLRHAPAPVADAFCATRLGGDWGRAFGTLPAGLDARAIVDRARIDEA